MYTIGDWEKRKWELGAGARWTSFFGVKKDFVTAPAKFAACKKEASPANPVKDIIDTTTAPVKYRGSFINGTYGTVTGAASVLQANNGNFTLTLKNVTISNGPDMHVYLSKEIQPVNFIDLGRLKSTSGNQVHNINGSPNFGEYKCALIHCQQFNHLFGSAELKP
jgi:Electron transfer DM13